MYKILINLSEEEKINYFSKFTLSNEEIKKLDNYNFLSNSIFTKNIDIIISLLKKNNEILTYAQMAKILEPTIAINDDFNYKIFFKNDEVIKKINKPQYKEIKEWLTNNEII